MTENLLQKNIKTLELDKVLAKLSEAATLEETKEAALSLCPETDFGKVEHLNNQTIAAYKLIAINASPSFGHVKNVKSFIARATMGGMLNMGELLKIGELLRVTRGVSNWGDNCGAENTVLGEYFSALSPNKYFEDKIFGAIISEEEMSDNASVTLAEIRKKIKKAGLSVRDKLEKIVKGSQSKYLQDAVVTQREGRFVVPVKQEHKSSIEGLVHDTSSSGATLFVEPMAVVELNNEIRVLKSKEKDEIERILYELSSEAASFGEAFVASYSALVSLDLIFAKASLAYSMKAVPAKLNNSGYIKLNKARHPLLNKDTVVPVSLELGKSTKLFLITGPNTGGKTVTLKTIGLLTFMAECGLMIPADDESEISVFNKVLADIGDEQSIEQSLSTFSSHIKNIKNILAQSGKGSLILFDELCAGTDPVEGAALAESILEELIENGSLTAATTHYAELKSYALSREGALNASCEFDVDTLMPTYRLLIGIPGRSNAFSISQKLGISEKIVNRATALISEEDKRFDNVLNKLQTSHIVAENERQKAEELRIELNKAKLSAEKKLSAIHAESDKIIEKARNEAEQILDYARSESNRLINELEDIKSKINKENAADSMMKARKSTNAALKNIEGKNDSNKEDSFTDYVLPRALKIGDTLKVFGFSKPATLIKQDGNTLSVAVGNIKTKVDIKQVKLVVEKEKVGRPERKVSGLTSNAEREIKRELDIRGQSVDEGLIELDRFIDSCILTGVTVAYVIHGKGTGVLRDAVRSHLKGIRPIKSFRPGVYGEGENGVTVIEFK